MLGTNEAYGRVKRMMGQSNTGGIEYPSGTNMRGSGGREHHAQGGSVGDVNAAPGHGGSMMKPHFGAPQHGRDTGSRSKAIAQVHGENHKEGVMVGREAHGFGARVGRMADKAAGQAGRGMNKAVKATSGAMSDAGSAIKNSAQQSGNAIQKSANQTGNAMKKAMPRPMYRGGGRTENH